MSRHSSTLPWQKSESVWYRLHWVDGRHELPRGDHGPGWPVISDLERGRFVWPSAKEGKVALTPAQLAMLLEGIDWRTPQRSWQPLMAG